MSNDRNALMIPYYARLKPSRYNARLGRQSAKREARSAKREARTRLV
jgi:hypothetical protein